MSLALVQDYSSEEQEQEGNFSDSDDSVQTDDDNSPSAVEAYRAADDEILAPTAAQNNISSASASALPSATSIFSEVTGPPAYLKDSVVDVMTSRARPRAPHKKFSKGSKVHQDSGAQKELPPGAVVHAKPQLVGLYDRVRSDNVKEETPKLPAAGMPPPEDAAKLLRVCLQCGVPKTYSGAKEGMVCPVCKDQPRVEDMDKRRGSKIKDKERSKRMKGQSSHATWKSETEMHLRQQFD